MRSRGREEAAVGPQMRTGDSILSQILLLNQVSKAPVTEERQREGPTRGQTKLMVFRGYAVARAQASLWGSVGAEAQLG